MIMAPNIYEKLVIPKKYLFVSISKDEAEYIYSFLREKKIKKTLEIGLAFGCSAAYIISATQNQHYAMDPFQEKADNLGLKNIKNLSFDKYLKFKEDYSYNVLPELLKEGMKFDFVFIDGDHRFDFAFVDYFYADLLLKQDGYILFHDSWMPSLQMVSSWIKNNRKDYNFIATPIKNLILFQKKGMDNRSWNHFKVFYPSRSTIEEILYKLISKVQKHAYNFAKRILSIFRNTN